MKYKILILSGVLLIGVVTYLSVMSHTKANEASIQYEHYYDNNNDSLDSEAVNDTNTDEDDGVSIDWAVISHMTIKSTPDLDLNSISLYVNKEYSLPKDYVPNDMVVPNVSFSFNYYHDRKLMRKEAATALERLFEAATNQGLSLNAVSGYRSYNRQFQIFTTNIRTKGETHTLKYSAIPGTSEHQTGLAIDVSSKSIQNKLIDAFADTAEGTWLKDNAHKYGYIIRYPKGKEHITGYAYEPWHIRYVGVDLASFLYTTNLTLDEYYSYTQSPDFDFRVKYADIINYRPPVVTPVEDDILEEIEIDEENITDEELDEDGSLEEEITEDDTSEEDDTNDDTSDDTLIEDAPSNDTVTDDNPVKDDTTVGDTTEDDSSQDNSSQDDNSEGDNSEGDNSESDNSGADNSQGDSSQDENTTNDSVEDDSSDNTITENEPLKNGTEEDVSLDTLERKMTVKEITVDSMYFLSSLYLI